MKEVLNPGLNFAILPLKLDITQVLVDFKKYERSMIWKEFWFNREEENNNFTPPIFKEDKTNLPKNHKVPEGLKIMLGAVKSEIVDPKNRNKVESNISKELVDALTELIKLQKMRQIIIKRCNKRAGIIILDYEEYVCACYAHLDSRQTNQDGTTSPYYTKVEHHEIVERPGQSQII